VLNKVIAYFASLHLTARAASWGAALCALSFIAAVAGSIYCGSELLLEGLDIEREIYLRRLIYFHFALSQLSILVALGLYFLRRLQLRRYYLIVSYNARGMGIDPLGIKAPASCVFYSCLGALDKYPLPPVDAPILVYPMMMQSGFSSGDRLNDELKRAYAKKGENPDLLMQSVLGASPLLPALAAKIILEKYAFLKENSKSFGSVGSVKTLVLVLAHLPAHGMESAPEPALFCRRLRALLSGMKVELTYFAEGRDYAELFDKYSEKRIIILPFLLTQGMHSKRDLPSLFDAESRGKELLLLPCMKEYLS